MADPQFLRSPLGTPQFVSPTVVSPTVVSRPVVAAPQTNCSVEDVVVQTQVCTPAFQTTCAKEDLPVKVIIEKDQCEPITRTVCSEATEVVDQTICVYTYIIEEEQGVATTAEVSFVQECKQEYYQVCTPVAHGYGHGVSQAYGGYD